MNIAFATVEEELIYTLKLLSDTRTERDQLQRRLAEAQRDAAAVRELMNVYNLGGWTDAVGPMKRALAAETALREITVYTGEGPRTTPWQAIVKDITDHARAALADIPYAGHKFSQEKT